METSHADRLARKHLDILPSHDSRPEESPEYDSAFAKWTALLGSAYVHDEDAARDSYAMTTLPKGTRPFGIVEPCTVEEVSGVVKIAEEHHIPLHPISRGKNWGYGDACAPTDGYVIVDLGRMNRIREVNAELGYAIVEPGVTQRQMYDYIQENNLSLLLDVTGAGPDASITGNILQRGFGHTPYGDRFRHTCGLEVVLRDGSVFHTGFGQFHQARASHVYHWGLGPWVDGLFTQSNYGIVTSVCFWLMPVPERIEAFAFKTNHAKLGETIDVLRRLRLARTAPSTIHLANDLRVLSARMSYPWERTGGKTPLSSELREELRSEYGLGDWNGIGGLYGTRTEVRAARRVIKKSFRGIAKVFFFDRKALNYVHRAASCFSIFGWARRLVSTTDNAASVFDLLEGIPNESHTNGSFWRDRRETPIEERDPRTSGLIWCSPVIPATRDDARRLLKLINPIFTHFGFDLLITMSSINERALCCVTSINYNKQDPADTERAAACYNQLNAELESAGYLPYRKPTVIKHQRNEH